MFRLIISFERNCIVFVYTHEANTKSSRNETKIFAREVAASTATTEKQSQCVKLRERKQQANDIGEYRFERILFLYENAKQQTFAICNNKKDPSFLSEEMLK